MLLIYHNGKVAKKLEMLGYNEYISGLMLNPRLGPLFDGYLSDFNIFSRYFDEKELEQWTTCKSFEKGDLLSWDDETVANFTFTTTDPKYFMEILTVDEIDLCTEKKNKPYILEVFLTGSISNFDAELICKHLNGELLVLPTTGYELSLLKEQFLHYKRQSNVTTPWKNPWLGGVVKREGEALTKDFYPSSGYSFYDRKTGKDLILEKVVRDEIWPEPQSFSYLPELCPQMANYTKSFKTESFLFVTQKCTRKMHVAAACKFEKKPVLNLRKAIKIKILSKRQMFPQRKLVQMAFPKNDIFIHILNIFDTDHEYI